MRAADGRLAVVMFVPDSGRPSGASVGEIGTLWYAELRGTSWAAVSRVGRIEGAEPRPEASSALVAHAGGYAFAMGYGDPSHPGGLLLFRRSADAHWSVDSLVHPFGPMYVTMGPTTSGAQELIVYFVASAYVSDTLRAGPLFKARFDGKWRAPEIVVNDSHGSLIEPRVLTVGARSFATWRTLSQRRGDSARVWVADLSGVPGSAVPRQVLAGTNEVTALPVAVAGDPALLWLYRLPMRSTSRLGGALLLGGSLELMQPVALVNELHFEAAPDRNASVDVLTGDFPTPGTSELPVSHSTRFSVVCGKGEK